jgi:hypothetical protein
MLLIASDAQGDPTSIVAAPTMTTPTILDFDEAELRKFEQQYYGAMSGPRP